MDFFPCIINFFCCLIKNSTVLIDILRIIKDMMGYGKELRCFPQQLWNGILKFCCFFFFMACIYVSKMLFLPEWTAAYTVCILFNTERLSCRKKWQMIMSSLSFVHSVIWTLSLIVSDRDLWEEIVIVTFNLQKCGRESKRGVILLVELGFLIFACCRLNDH